MDKFKINCGKTISAKPYIGKHEKSYTAYIPYYHDDKKCNFINAYWCAMYFDLPINREDGNPSYTYSYSDKVHEIGITHNELSKIYDKINIIQKAIEKKGGIVCKVDNIEDYIVTDYTN